MEDGLQSDVLPSEKSVEAEADGAATPRAPNLRSGCEGGHRAPAAGPGASVRSWLASEPREGAAHGAPAIATVVRSKLHVAADSSKTSTRHIVLDFGAAPFQCWRVVDRASCRPAVTHSHSVAGHT